MESDDPDSLANYHQTYQVATGQGWASLGVGIRPAVPSRAAWQSALGRFAAHAATLGCREGDSPEAVAEGAAYARKAARRELLAAVFLALVSIASLIGSVMLIVLGLVHVNEGSAVGGVAVFIFLFMPTAVIFGILKWQQRKRRRLEGWDRALGVLRSTGLFDQVKRRPRKEECQLAAVHFAGPEAALRSIDVSRELSFAKSSRLALRACLDLHEVEWLRSTRQACRIVPGKYAVITLTGARHLLEKLPRGPREVRSTGSVSWTFTESEAEPLIRAAAAALDSSADHPYR